MPSEPLHEIAPQGVPQFLETLNSCHPQSGSIQATIRKTVAAAKKDAGLAWTLLTTDNGNNTGTCVFMMERGPSTLLCFFAREDEETNLVDALKRTSRIPWSKSPRIYRMNETLLEPLRAAFRSKVKFELESERIEMQWISSHKILDLDDGPVPKGLALRSLDERDVPTIAKTWTYEGPDVLKSTIEQGTCIGLESEKGDLAGWILWGQCGGLASLHVCAEYRRRGIARFLTIKMSKILAENGYDLIMGNVACTNNASKALLHGLGFQHAFFDYYVYTEYIGNN